MVVPCTSGIQLNLLEEFWVEARATSTTILRLIILTLPGITTLLGMRISVTRSCDNLGRFSLFDVLGQLHLWRHLVATTLIKGNATITAVVMAGTIVHHGEEYVVHVSLSGGRLVAVDVVKALWAADGVLRRRLLFLLVLIFTINDMRFLYPFNQCVRLRGAGCHEMLVFLFWFWRQIVLFNSQFFFNFSSLCEIITKLIVLTKSLLINKKLTCLLQVNFIFKVLDFRCCLKVDITVCLEYHLVVISDFLLISLNDDLNRSERCWLILEKIIL